MAPIVCQIKYVLNMPDSFNGSVAYGHGDSMRGMHPSSHLPFLKMFMACRLEKKLYIS